MGEIVKKANTGVRRHGMRTTVLNKIFSARGRERFSWCAVVGPAGLTGEKLVKCGSWRRRREKGFSR